VSIQRLAASASTHFLNRVAGDKSVAGGKERDRKGLFGCFSKNESEKKNLSAALYRVLFFFYLPWAERESFLGKKSLYFATFLVNIHDPSQSLFS
jgi:hypothetical protein